MKKLFDTIEEAIGQKFDRARYLLVGNAFQKRTLFLYEDNHREPSLVVKIPGSEEGDARCVIEYQGLEYLSRQNIPRIISSKPVRIIKYNGTNCYIQTTVYGKPMLSLLSLYTRSLNEKYFHRITDHLIEIYNNTKQIMVGGRSFCKCFQHGDFWIGNLGLSSDSIVLYDLEFSTEKGIPLFDLLHFGLYFKIVSDNIGRVGEEIVRGDYNRKNEKRNFFPTHDTVANMLAKPNRLSKIMKLCIKKYLYYAHIDEPDGIYLIKDYIENDRGIIGMGKDWEKHILD